MSTQDPGPTTYRIEQLGPPRDRQGELVHAHGAGTQINEPVTGFDTLVLHHPGDNRAARMQDGVVVGGKGGRAFGYIGGQLQDIEIPRLDRHGRFRTFDLRPDQVLFKKDFILSDPGLDPTTREGRRVDVPAPVAGVIGARRDREGLVDILDRPDGDVIARVRHMRDIAVNPGDRVTYGQALGVQSDMDTKPIHVHMEMDTRYYLQFRNYVDDLASGRLPIEAEHRQGVLPRPVAHDGSFRLGESGERIRDLQRVMAAEGYRSAGGTPLDQDGVYRPRMQGALLDFQRDHGVPQSGDIDVATLRFAPSALQRAADRRDHVDAGRFPALEPAPPTAPGHPDHPDHRPLPAQPEPARNQHRAGTALFADPQLRQLAAALEGGGHAGFAQACADLARSPRMEAFLARGREALAAQERQHDGSREAEAAAPARG